MKKVKFTFVRRYYKAITTEMEIPEGVYVIDYIDQHFDRSKIEPQDLEFEDEDIYVEDEED